MKRILLALAALFALTTSEAQAQSNNGAQVVAACGGITYSLGLRSITQDVNGNLCTAASVSASISGFAPGGTFATLTATGSSASVALPAGAVVVFQNTGTTAVSCVLGVGSATATASKNIIQPASWMAFTVGSNTFGACIDQTGSASNLVVLSGGAGLPTGAGGGSSSGGGGGTSSTFDAAFPSTGTAAGLSDGTNMKAWLTALALADGVNGNNTGAVATWLWNGTTYDRARGDTTSGAWVNVKTSAPTGAAADAACGTATGTCSLIALIKFLNTAASGAIPAGTANIGNVGGNVNVTPTDCSGTITTGGTAQNAFTAQSTLHGFTIVNLSTDPMWISFTGTAVIGTQASYLLAAGSATVQGGSYSTPLGFGMNTALSVIAATTGDKFSCTRW